VESVAYRQACAAKRFPGLVLLGPFFFVSFFLGKQKERNDRQNPSTYQGSFCKRIYQGKPAINKKTRYSRVFLFIWETLKSKTKKV
jgi:hypothetical protein